MTERIIDAEIVGERPAQETPGRVVQVTPELEIERLKTRRAELATQRSAKRWGVAGSFLVISSIFFSCAQMCNPWFPP